MPLLQLMVDAVDAPIGERLQQDLSTRGWGVSLAGFGSALLVGNNLGVDHIVCWIPTEATRQLSAYESLRALDSEETALVLAVPNDSATPEWLMARNSVQIIHQNRIDYDRSFEDLLRSLLMPWASWLDVRVRPSVMQQPTGVDWWSEDLIVADERYEHIVRVGPDSSGVLLPGLSEPHHVFIDRRRILVANKAANEILISELADDMATNIWSLRECEPGVQLAHPHAAVQSHDCVAIADTDNHRLFLGRGRFVESAATKWKTIEDADQLQTPCSVFIDGDTIWVASTFSHRVVAFSHDGDLLGSFGGYGDEPGQFRYPVALCTWRDYLFVADEENKRIQVFQKRPFDQGPPPSIETRFGGPWVRSPFGLGINRSNRLAVTDRDRRCVWLIDLEEALA